MIEIPLGLFRKRVLKTDEFKCKWCVYIYVDAGSNQEGGVLTSHTHAAWLG